MGPSIGIAALSNQGKTQKKTKINNGIKDGRKGHLLPLMARPVSLENSRRDSGEASDIAAPLSDYQSQGKAGQHPDFPASLRLRVGGQGPASCGTYVTSGSGRATARKGRPRAEGRSQESARSERGRGRVKERRVTSGRLRARAEAVRSASVLSGSGTCAFCEAAAEPPYRRRKRLAASIEARRAAAAPRSHERQRRAELRRAGT